MVLLVNCWHDIMGVTADNYNMGLTADSDDIGVNADNDVAA